MRQELSSARSFRLTVPTCFARCYGIVAYSPASGRSPEPGERIEEALIREICEELGTRLEILDIQPWTFGDDVRLKTYPDSSTEEIDMIHLIFDCRSANRDVTINDEFDEHAWVRPDDLPGCDLNEATALTLRLKGLLK